MMETISILAISILVVFVFSFLSNLINLKRHKRSKQVFIPIYALIISILSMCLIIYIMEAHLRDNFQDYKMMEIFVSNIFVYFVFIVIKVFLISYCNKRKVEESRIALKFYEYDSYYSEWFLKDNQTSVRILFKYLKNIYVIICGLVLGITWSSGTESVWWLQLYPILVLIVVNEIYYYLNGYTKEEYSHMIFGDASQSQRYNNYYKIRDIFERMFTPQLLSSNTSCDFNKQESIKDYLKLLEESENNTDYLTAKFFQLNEGEEKYDVDYINGINKIMNKENVIFLNPFYKDLGKYIILPFINALISNQNCLVVVGRNSAKEDVHKWIKSILKDYCKFDSIWTVGNLSNKYSKYDVGLMSFHELYDLKMIERNKEFFNHTGFVFILEPSLVINTGQIGFSIVVEQMRLYGLSPTYCIADRNVDGLVDTMSHILHEKITEVIAPPAPRYINTAMAWDVDGDFKRESLFDKQTRYLGNGFELAAVAVKNQVPHVSWISESKAPIKDLKWIVGQYYSTLCKFMNIPIQQKSIYDKIDFISNLWELPRRTNQFIVVDDEFCNLFSMMQTFLTRGEEQVFINVMSENYLLRDYMRCNQQMFKTNVNSIPSIVPDYAKTERNTILKLLFIMSYRSMTESEIRKEFELMNYEFEDVHYTLNNLANKYTFVDRNIFQIQTENKSADISSIDTELIYSVIPGVFSEKLAKSLKSAYFIIENENKENDFIDAKLFSHVTQSILPGQFVIYDGKYYMVNHISVDNGVVLRRASNLYDGRRYYRQMRNYHIDKVSHDSIVSVKNIMDVETVILKVDFHVDTYGYLEMDNNKDLRKAKEIKITQQTILNEIRREYKNKNILRVYLPEINEEMRFTICLLLMEMFRTIYPNTWQYIAVLTKHSSDKKGMLNYMNYELDGDINDDYIYIIEDSDLDLGLLESIEKNFTRFMEILADYIDWHFEKLREPEYKDPVVGSVVLPKDQVLPRESKNAIMKVLQKLSRFINKKEKDLVLEDDSKITKVEDNEDKKSSSNTNEDNTSTESEELQDIMSNESDESEDYASYEELSDNNDILDETNSESINNESNNQTKHYESQEDFEATTDIFDTDMNGEFDSWFEDRFQLMELGKVNTRYNNECFLKFGFNEIDKRIQLEEVIKYLNARGWAQNNLTKARRRDVVKSESITLDAVNCCDFCNKGITGVSFDRLDDGRIRCHDCSSSAINTVEEFRDIFYHVLSTMESFYGINYKVPISIQMADANTIASRTGQIFKPSIGFAERVLGFAQKYKGTYRILMENGSPRIATINTMVHEMTHIWQYLNWDNQKMIQIYGNERNKLIVYEGMAMWASIQYLYMIGETSKAYEQEIIALNRQDEYGIGFRLYCQKYPLVKDSSILRNTPFTVFPPL